MATEIKKEIELEIAHVVFIDIVGYSKRLINEQRRLLELLNQIVRATEQFRTAEPNARAERKTVSVVAALVSSAETEQ